MAYASRESDNQLLDWITARSKGQTCAVIGARQATTAQRVSTATKRVADDDRECDPTGARGRYLWRVQS
jgi:hypothetical protein